MNVVLYIDFNFYWVKFFFYVFDFVSFNNIFLGVESAALEWCLLVNFANCGWFNNTERSFFRFRESLLFLHARAYSSRS